jgi:hypothetical protein
MTGQIYLCQGTFDRLDSFRVTPCMTVRFNLSLDALYRSDSICVLARDGTDSIRVLACVSYRSLSEFGNACRSDFV